MERMARDGGVRRSAVEMRGGGDDQKKEGGGAARWIYGGGRRVREVVLAAGTGAEEAGRRHDGGGGGQPRRDEQLAARDAVRRRAGVGAGWKKGTGLTGGDHVSVSQEERGGGLDLGAPAGCGLG
uniref:DUF834 domain-containing protein n=1 Tax=Oryza brachyantha TaxID=4533 RepID=J3N1D2_ORYBR